MSMYVCSHFGRLAYVHICENGYVLVVVLTDFGRSALIQIQKFCTCFKEEAVYLYSQPDANSCTNTYDIVNK